MGALEKNLQIHVSLLKNRFAFVAKAGYVYFINSNTHTRNAETEKERKDENETHGDQGDQHGPMSDQQ